ncbi:glutamate--cysteine ligase, chloroplastic-like [Carex rostrata]
MTADWTREEREMMRIQVPVTGLKTPFRDRLLRHVAEDVLKMAKDGLERRGYKESGFLREIAEEVMTGVTPAEKFLEDLNCTTGTGEAVLTRFLKNSYIETVYHFLFIFNKKEKCGV